MAKVGRDRRAGSRPRAPVRRGSARRNRRCSPLPLSRRNLPAPAARSSCSYGRGPMRVEQLRTGAEARISNEGGRLVAVLVNGGTAKAVPGTWSATSELLAVQLAPRFPNVSFVEVRYRVKTWKALDSCIQDADAALELAASNGAGLPFWSASRWEVPSRSVSSTPPRLSGVLGLAPWIPPELPVDGLHGKRFDVVHGAWDRYLPGIPGVSPGHSRAAWQRARRLGAEGTYSVIPRGLHGCAVRSRRGGLVRLPRWRAWVEHTAAGIERFAADRGLMYRFLQLSVGTLMRLVWRLRVDGADRMPAGGGRPRGEPRVGARPALPRGGVPAAAALPDERGAVAQPSRRPHPRHLWRDQGRARPRRPGRCVGRRPHPRGRPRRRRLPARDGVAVSLAAVAARRRAAGAGDGGAAPARRDRELGAGAPPAPGEARGSRACWFSSGSRSRSNRGRRPSPLHAS